MCQLFLTKKYFLPQPVDLQFYLNLKTKKNVYVNIYSKNSDGGVSICCWDIILNSSILITYKYIF